MILRSKLPIVLGLAFGLLTGIYILFSLNSRNLAIVMGIAGFFMATSLLSYLRRRKPKKDEAESFNYSLRNNKDVIYEGAANLFVNNKQITGYLYLLSDKLIFQSKSFKIALKHELVLELNRVKEVSFAKTNHVLDKIIVIVTEKGEERFLVKGHQLWIDEIEKALFNYSLANKTMPISKAPATRKTAGKRNKAV